MQSAYAYLWKQRLSLKFWEELWLHLSLPSATRIWTHFLPAYIFFSKQWEKWEFIHVHYVWIWFNSASVFPNKCGFPWFSYSLLPSFPCFVLGFFSSLWWQEITALVNASRKHQDLITPNICNVQMEMSAHGCSHSSFFFTLGFISYYKTFLWIKLFADFTHPESSFF